MLRSKIVDSTINNNNNFKLKMWNLAYHENLKTHLRSLTIHMYNYFLLELLKCFIKIIL